MKNVECDYLYKVRADGSPVTVYMTNGYQMKGIVKEFDDNTLLVDCGGTDKMVYKHAVSTIEVMGQVSDEQ